MVSSCGVVGPQSHPERPRTALARPTELRDPKTRHRPLVSRRSLSSLRTPVCCSRLRKGMRLDEDRAPVWVALKPRRARGRSDSYARATPWPRYPPTPWFDRGGCGVQMTKTTPLACGLRVQSTSRDGLGRTGLPSGVHLSAQRGGSESHLWVNDRVVPVCQLEEERSERSMRDWPLGPCCRHQEHNVSWAAQRSWAELV
jgi:hypothetical protein